MDAFFWWSGLAFWGVLAVLGVLTAIDLSAEHIINQWGFRREFMAFVWGRLKRRKGYVEPEIVTKKGEL